MDKYSVVSEKRRVFHGSSDKHYYGLKNGFYVSGTTTESFEDSLALLEKICKVKLDLKEN